MNDPRPYLPDTGSSTIAEHRHAGSTSSVTGDLGHLTLLAIAGPDATAFLQGQLTNDVATLAPGRWHWTGYCGPKGRLIAVVRLIKTSDGFLAETPADIAADLISRLRRFILRAKVTLTPWNVAPIGLGIAGADGAAGLARWRPGAVPTTGAADSFDGGVLVNAGTGRWHCYPATESEAGILRGLLPGNGAPLSAGEWARFDLDDGIPWIVAATQELFVPQMVDLELLGGVSFTKGCYPGQEIVARSQYLGAVKRRLYRARYRIELAAGAPLSSPLRPGQTVGNLVGAAPAGSDAYHVLAVLDVDCATAGAVHPSPGGSPLEELSPVHPRA